MYFLCSDIITSVKRPYNLNSNCSVYLDTMAYLGCCNGVYTALKYKIYNANIANLGHALMALAHFLQQILFSHLHTPGLTQSLVI